VIVRAPAVAGRFYPADPATLAAEIDRHLAGAPAASGRPKAVIAPHAGYVYSGPVAGSAFRPWLDNPPPVTRVVLLGPAHRRPCRLAAPAADAFATPLGTVPVDHAAINGLIDAGLAEIDERAHAGEHSLEVELPFLQRLFAKFALVPLVVGDVSATEVAAVIEALWGGPETVVVVSSDLSHYLDPDSARRRDRATADAVKARDADRIGFDDACGARPVAGLLTVAARRGLRISVADLRNSGDTAGPAPQVVGYGAFHVLPPP
jgi:AmmeMemoRadiSam system protein B